MLGELQQGHTYKHTPGRSLCQHYTMLQTVHTYIHSLLLLLAAIILWLFFLKNTTTYMQQYYMHTEMMDGVGTIVELERLTHSIIKLEEKQCCIFQIKRVIWIKFSTIFCNFDTLCLIMCSLLHTHKCLYIVNTQNQVLKNECFVSIQFRVCSLVFH